MTHILKIYPYSVTHYTENYPEIARITKHVSLDVMQNNEILIRGNANLHNNEFRFIIKCGKDAKHAVDYLLDEGYCKLVNEYPDELFDFLTVYYLVLTEKALLTAI